MTHRRENLVELDKLLHHQTSQNPNAPLTLAQVASIHEDANTVPEVKTYLRNLISRFGDDVIDNLTARHYSEVQRIVRDGMTRDIAEERALALEELKSMITGEQ
jgi:hypothetical protein